MADNQFESFLRRVGRAASPLLDPDAPQRTEREEETRQTLRETEQTLQTLMSMLSRLEHSVEQLRGRVNRIDRGQVEKLRETAKSLKVSHKMQVAFVERLLKQSHANTEREMVRDRVFRRLRALRGRGPIIVGPWTGEVGFELLYWVPFVRWACRHFLLDPSRLIIVSRGGTESWYGIEGARYVDVLSRRTPAELAAQMGVKKKQRTVRLFDRRLIRELASELGDTPGLLHPSLMYAVMMPYWKQTVSLQWVQQYTNFTRITPPELPELSLPERYVAVRFYFSDCFPDTEDNRALARTVLTELARAGDVVSIGSSVVVDEHRDALIPELSSRVRVVDHMLTPATNLAVQTAVLSRASAFVGTYGGFSYLAPLCGVDTVAFYSDANFYEHHLDFAQQTFAKVGGGSLTVIDTAVRDLVARAARVTADT